MLEATIAQERPDALLPTVGGQTGLNLALSESGALARYGLTLLGASLEAIQAAEDRERFAALLASLETLSQATSSPAVWTRRARPRR